MKILLSNDDGFIATGLNALHRCLSEQYEVMAVAPDRDRSAASNSLTLDSPLRITERGQNFYSVNGTPTDCVHLALTGLYDNAPDIVISGINAGENMGDDVIYSGTVAAAMEGRNLGLPAIAVSLASFQPQYFATAVEAVVVLLRQLSDFGEKSDTILNVNVPDVPWGEIKGFQATRLGKRHKAESVIKDKDPRGNDIYWVGPPGKQQEAGEGTDFYAVEHGYISVTPLHIDLTRHQAIDATKNWLQSI
ncbi:MAG: 5'/3'-nucleotidase SurE [Aquificaceae bacterium]|nr:MAG: 5'/3'-nucleotidase SurE [Aquificaceae bacterium]